MKKQSSSWLIYALSAIVVVGLIAYAVVHSSAPADPKTEALAQCLTDKGVKMYGAWWCPHCKSQKALFGKAFSKINYTECADPGTNGMNATCKNAGIEAYPTWEFADATRVTGEVSLENLAAKAECSL